MQIEGKILKSTGGFYYVEASNNILYECRARGIFRKDDYPKPYTGDNVIIDLKEREHNKATITEILNRKNSFLRPPVANVDNILIVCSVCQPKPSFLNIDKIIALAEYQNIQPIVVVSKTDLASDDSIGSIYKDAGIKTFYSSVNGENIASIKKELSNQVTAFTGNSGVGKSTLLNLLFPSLNIKTSPISKKLGRGKHTTRDTEMYHLENSYYVIDTPGFSSIDFNRYDKIKDENKLASCFREIYGFTHQCKFVSCSHTCEKGCAVIQAVEDGKIPKSRFESYVSIYNEIKNFQFHKK